MTLGASAKEKIPYSILKPIFDEYIRTYETGHRSLLKAPDSSGYGKQGGYPPTWRPPSAAGCVAFQAEIDVNTFTGILRGRTQGLTFDMADKLLCTMNLVHLWYEHPELKKIYARAVRYADKMHPIVETENAA